MVKILGRKPSDIRKDVLVVLGVLAVLLAAIPSVGLSAQVAAGLAAATALVAGLNRYLARGDVATVIDSTDSMGE